MKTRRKKKLVKVRFQLRWMALVMLASGFCLAIQATILVMTLGNLAQVLPEDGEALLAALPGAVSTSVGASALILLPFLGFVAMFLTFRIAGPVYRMENYLKDRLAGKEQGPCSLRKDDDFQELCVLINQVIAQQDEDASATAKQKTAA